MGATPPPGARCPVPVPGRRACRGAPCWRRRDDVWFCATHACGHVHLSGAAGDLGWWRIEREVGRDEFWLHDDRPGGAFGFVFPLDGRRWSIAGVAWENDYGPESLTALLAPAVRAWATTAR